MLLVLTHLDRRLQSNRLEDQRSALPGSVKPAAGAASGDEASEASDRESNPAVYPYIKLLLALYYEFIFALVNTVQQYCNYHLYE